VFEYLRRVKEDLKAKHRGELRVSSGERGRIYARLEELKDYESNSIESLNQSEYNSGSVPSKNG
jgi:hypothetical protein